MSVANSAAAADARTRSFTLGAHVTAIAFDRAGTVGAFAVGMVLLRQEHKREEVRNEEQRRSQAVKVSAWLEATRNAQGGRDPFFHVHNASDMPIFEVALASHEADAGEAEFIALVPPGQTVQRPAPREWLKGYHAPEPVQIEFLDSSGRRWARDEEGTLRAADDGSLPRTS